MPRLTMHLRSTVPGNIATVIFNITNKEKKAVKLAVPCKGSVSHPVNFNDGPWTVSATLVKDIHLKSAEVVSTTADVVVWHSSDITLTCDAALSDGQISSNIMVDSGTIPSDKSNESSTHSVLDQASGWTRLTAAAPASAVSTSNNLVMQMQLQMQTQWNWAACTASVAAYYNDSPNITQCALVNWAFAQTSCCVYGSSPQCNQPFSLQSGLSHVGNLNNFMMNTMSMAMISAEIDASRPVLVRMLWYGTSIGHCIAITGYDTVAGTITVQDTWSGTSVLIFRTFPGNYMSGGAWTHSYTTRAH